MGILWFDIVLCTQGLIHIAWCCVLFARALSSVVFPFFLMTGPFKHMINAHADVENLDSRPLSRGGWATVRSQLPPLRASPRDADPPRPASRNTLSPRPVSRGSILRRPSGLDSPKPQNYTGRESPRETDIRPKTALNRRESRPGNSSLNFIAYDINLNGSVSVDFTSDTTQHHYPSFPLHVPFSFDL